MSHYMKWMAVAGAAAVLLLLMSVQAEPSRDLAPNELAAIRGAQPTEGGCVPSNPQTGCINPAKWPNGSPKPSDCENCWNTWKNITWDARQAQQCQYHHNHGCATTGTEYLNSQYWFCVTPSTPNNLVCSSGTLDCHWRVDCDEGGLVADKNCGGAGPYTCTTNAPSVLIGGTFPFYTIQCKACYVCTTGAPNVPPKQTVDNGECVNPPPGA